jgi:peptidyl-prolyl cis-trans isomerase SurA
MKGRVWLAIVALISVWVGLAIAADRILLEGILVRVNDRVMTVSDFRERLEVELSQLPERPSPDELENFVREVFVAAVDEMVLLERAREKKLTINDEMIDEAIENLKKENNLEDEEAYEAALASAGITEEMLRDRYRQNMLLQRAVQSEIKPSEITEQEVRQRYDEDIEQFRVPAKVELEQVFFAIASDGSNRSEVKRIAQGVVDRVRSGNDLRAEATLAGADMQELGGIPVDDLRPVIADALEGLEDGDVTDPVDTAGGFLVVRLIRRIPEGYESFEDVQELIRRRISQEVYRDQTQGMVERLKNVYMVEIYEDRLEAILDQIPSA